MEVLFSGVPVADLATAVGWYEGLFGRPADVIVNDDVQRAFDELRSITVAERARRQRRAPLAEALLRAGRLS